MIELLFYYPCLVSVSNGRLTHITLLYRSFHYMFSVNLRVAARSDNTLCIYSVDVLASVKFLV